MRLLIPALLIPVLAGQEHGRRPSNLVVCNALVMEGNGTPASGPRDIFLEDDTITQISPWLAASAKKPTGMAIIDARTEVKGNVSAAKYN